MHVAIGGRLQIHADVVLMTPACMCGCCRYEETTVGQEDAAAAAAAGGAQEGQQQQQ